MRVLRSFGALSVCRVPNNALSTWGAHHAVAVQAVRRVLVAMIMLIKAIELTLFPAVMAFAASSDLFTMAIANRISLILVAGFGLLAVLPGMNASDLLSHFGAGAVVWAVVFVFFARGWIGGGDAKLAAATALWFGFEGLLSYLFAASLLGGGLTLLMIQFRM